MNTSKTLAARLRERLSLRHMGNCKCGKCQLVPADLVAEAADYLDRLSAPDVGAGLTRYRMWVRIDWNVDPDVDPDGEWVRFEDVAPLLAAARAVPADVSALIAELEKAAQSVSEASKMIADAKTARNRAAEGEPDDGPGYDWLKPEQTVEGRAAVALAASTVREKAKDAEIAELKADRKDAEDRAERAVQALLGFTPGHEAGAMVHAVCILRPDAALSGRKPDTKEGA